MMHMEERIMSDGGVGMMVRDLSDIVLSWTLDDILDDDLFADKVNLIPSSFQSLDVYLESYIPSLLEETRAELSSCFEFISDAPSYKIQCIEAAKSSLFYYVDVDCSSIESSGTNDDYKPMNGDIYILSSIKPESVDDFRRYGVNICMVMVSEVTSDDVFLRGFKVKASKLSDKKGEFTGYRNAIFVANIMTNIRIWKSLHFNAGVNNNFSVIESVLHPVCSGDMICNVCSLERDCWFSKLPEEIVSIDLNESQIQAVKSAVSTLSCRHSHFVKLIWGPPGTGKTKTVCAILLAFMHMKCRILTCAPTNIAVVGVCSRLICLVKEFHDNNNSVDSFFTLADIVLVGRKDRMIIDDELQVVFLEHRVEQLVDCFSLMSGWKHRISAMIDFFEDCALQYESYLETRSGEGGEKLFLDFIRKQFNVVASPLEACLNNLCIHLPRSRLSGIDVRTIRGVIGLLENLRRLIFKDDVSNDEMQEIFLLDYSNAESSVVQDNSITCELELSAKMQLEETRSDCLKLLKSLKNSLSLPNGVNENWVKKYCLGNSSLIFCTASGAFLLHFMEMDPLDVLIVDEAAQLRESEIIIPLRLDGIKHAILVGDEIQLQSMVKSQVCKSAGFGLSLFERLVLLGQTKHLLRIQYRMHPSISLFPNVNFYGNQILDGHNVQSLEYGKHCSGLVFGSYAFVNITDGREEVDDIGGSRKNMVEVAIVVHLIKSIFKSWKVNRGSLSIGVIAPYSSQVKAIKEKLGNTYDTYSGFDVRVNSVDGFQGGEDDIIILSTVRSNTKGLVGFLSDIRRMNVALTRARHCLWILGNAETLFWSGTKWEELVNDAKKRRCFFQASEMEGLAKLIRHVKCELDQVDDLFNSNSALKSSMWKVFFSANFRKSFAKLKSLQTKKEVMQTMVRLANGWRSKRNNVILSDSFQLAKIYSVREHYLVWTIDIVLDERYIQVIKVWDILLLSQLVSFTSQIDRIFSMYTDSYISRCKEKCIKGNIEVPVSWNNNDILQYKKHCEQELEKNVELGQMDSEDVLENSKVSESLLLMKFYALTSGIASHLLTSSDGTELSIPFELTDEEKHVVRFSRSSFILGRSGTGKTTILTTKLVQKQQQHTLAHQGVCVLEGDVSRAAFRTDSTFECDETPPKRKILKQVFITVSPKLCLAIQDHINRLTSFATSGCLYGPSDNEMRDTSELLAQFVHIPDTFHALPNKHYPLVITFTKFLMMLDGSMSPSFFSKFCNDRDLSINGGSTSKFLALQMFFRKEVDFEKFVGSYWPHFSSQLTKKLDACSVYTEIISHIKGDLEAGSCLDGKLGRRDYIMLANKRVSSFCEDVRGDIYDIFLDYEKKKCLNGEFDIADFVIDLHQRLRCNVYLGDKFDYVYVDEVQDLTMRQVALLKYVCTNYDEGFVFAGDTAQTIARGVDFRFEDIRCLFYKEFTSELRTEDHGLKKGGERIKDNFQLNQNFRTHSGVLKLAKSIMDLLFSFFPLNIDRIAPETSLIYGESPVLLKSNNDENAIITIFGNSTGECSNMIEFGAEQVILVRDDCAKREIANLVGTKALVLTIIECKGLEFQDVLLYNFFGGSPLTNKWRVVYEYMNRTGIADQSGMTACPNFDHGRHSLLCSELKQLYVAITRTRQRLWISENSNDYCKPIFDYWKSLCLVQVRHLDSSVAQAMQTISTPDDWRVRGIKFFNEENFEMATMCFERAGDIYREKWARAAGLVCSTDSILSSKPEMAEDVLKKAADIYESIGKPESAATCYIKLKDFNSAGRLYLEKCGESSLEAAGDCFSMIEKWPLAADVYAKAKCFSKCLSMCSQGALFDTGLRFIKLWKDGSDFDKLKADELCTVEKSFLESCVMHYVKLRDITHMVELANVLQSMDLIRNSLKSGGLLDELLELEKAMGNYIEAADLAHFKGNILLETDMLQKVGHFEKSAGLILLHVIVNSLWAPGSNGWPLKKFANKEECLDKAKVIAKQVSDSFYDLVSSEAYLLSDGSKDLCNLSRYLVKAHNFQNIRLEIFTLREIIDIHLQFEPCKYLWEPGFVSDVDKHTNLIISQNICSVESLMHHWKLWKNKILKLLSHLSSSPQFKENDFELYEQFCFEYLGILINSDHNTFLLLNPEASWTNSCKISPKLGNLSMINFGQFKESAHQYWRSELISLGVEILEKLKLLISFSKCCVKTPCSKTACNVFEGKVLFPFSKARVILAIHEIVKFIRESDTSLESIDKINGVLTFSSEYFFSILFPIRWNEGSNMSMLDFHTSMNVREIIEESMDRDLRPFDGTMTLGRPFDGKMTLGQITRLVMLLFLTGNLKDRLYDNIIQKLKCMPRWHDLIFTFKGFLNFSSWSVSLILKLEQALTDAFSTDWRGIYDFMSPHCFMYLIDCLLFCASSCHGSGFPFFSTKATLFEMLRCHGLKGYMDTFFVATCDSPTSISVHNCLCSISKMIQILLKGKGEIKAWVMQSSMCQFDYCSLLTKMVITLCLAHLNSGRTFYLNKFLSHNCIMDDLPEKFREAIAGCWEVTKNLLAFSNALRVDQDSLVCVLSRDKKFDSSKLNAIVLKPEDLRCCENAIAKLFPKSLRSELKTQCEQELSSSISSGDVHNTCEIEAFAYSKSLIQAEILNKNEKVDLAIRINQDDLRKTCLHLCIDLNTRLRSCDEIKLDDIIHCLSALIAWISQYVQQRDGDPDIYKIRKMIIEIQFHSSSIDGGIEPPCMTVEELELRCPGWKVYLNSFIDSMLKEMNNKLSETVAEVVEEDICQETTDIADNCSETIAEVVEDEDSCKEIADVADNSSSSAAIKEAERANDSCPVPQDTNKNSKNKGNAKKSKQTYKAKGKGKKRR